MHPISAPYAVFPRVHKPVAVSLAAMLLLSGCVSNRYRMIKQRDKVPPAPINAPFAPSPVTATLNTLITYQGAGSWKRESLWDEYVITISNPGTEALAITSATLVDHTGAGHEPGSDPWALEKQSKTLEQRYKDAGMAFVRYTAPGVLIVGAGAVAISSAGVGIGGLSAGAATAASVTVIALPIYYLAVVGINSDNKAEARAEFNRRRLQLPLAFGPGSSLSGSLFFPMVASPRALKLGWRRGGESGEAVLTLDFLKGLHLKPPEPAAASLSVKPGSPAEISSGQVPSSPSSWKPG